ncbi:uncharacterized protein LOC111614206 isoform X2 [Centruroides sculpturatus]|uniref:uncharacterized protein LOC111614206 isoform X2 n=1 Tax=Centruroides sculpturatus TaxID=218467 RepID=UPI000C6C9814|nr:uncharacterized protein LOC111614206 isoform X2 [Centruroides sculpturatus]
MSSEYYKGLDELSRYRYKQKLMFNKQELPDPMDDDLAKMLFHDNVKAWPKITLVDLYAYFVDQLCFYTKQQLKNYTSLESYNYLVSGKVKEITVYPLTDLKICMLKGKIQSGQKKTFQHPWAVVQINGVIVSGHCTCMAGLGESCSHLGALLLTIEATVKANEETPCTSLPCSWKKFNREVEPSQISNICFSKSKHNNPFLPNKKQKTDMLSHPPTPTLLDQKFFLESLKATGKKTSIMEVTLSESDETETASESEFDLAPNEQSPEPSIIHKVLCFKDVSLSRTELENKLINEIKLTKQDIQLVESQTRDQANEDLWWKYRKGRLTASLFGRILRCKTAHKSIVKDVMQYQEEPHANSIEWGKKNESVAKSLFVQRMLPLHSNFQLSSTGLFIDEAQSFLAATPDGLVTCDCCSSALLEIKCLYSKRHLSVREAKPEFLDENLQLREEHEYYTQIQGQMGIAKVKECFFVCYSANDVHIQKINFNLVFWQHAVQKLSSFYFNYIVTEIFSESVKKELLLVRNTCLCNGMKSGTVILCSMCKYAFHIKCVNLSRTKQNWKCESCNSK